MTSKRKIAIVDDHTLFRKGLSTLISELPSYSVLFEASNGKEFIEKIQGLEVPDIVLLDITMPEMNGYETAKWIKFNYPSVKMLALSTMDTDESILRMVKNGVHGYLMKDSELEELKKAFESVLSIGYYYNDLVSRKIIRSVADLADDSSPLNILSKLTEREILFLKHCCSEKTYSHIASEMNVSERTVDGYREALFKKLNIGTRVGLVLYAIKNGIFSV